MPEGANPAGGCAPSRVEREAESKSLVKMSKIINFSSDNEGSFLIMLYTYVMISGYVQVHCHTYSVPLQGTLKMA